MAPSLTTLRKSLTDEQARAIRGLLTGKRDPMTFENVQKWVAQCYNMPSAAELIMEAANEVLGGFGVECIRGRYVDRYHMDIQAVYVNMGDTYDLTLLLDHETGRYCLTSVGDWFEANERRRELL